MEQEGRYSLERAQDEGFRMLERVKNKILQNYPEADFVANLELSPETELHEISFEQLKEFVSYPGTITHVTPTRPGEKESLKHWFDVAKGVSRQHKSSIEEDTGLSINTTMPDGWNPSVEGGKYYSLRPEGGAFSNDSLIIFSHEGQYKTYDLVDKIFEKALDEHVDLLSQKAFSNFLARYQIMYEPVHRNWELAVSPHLQVSFALFELKCTIDPKSVKDLDALDEVDPVGREVVRIVQHYSKILSSHGFRYRGIRQDGNKKIWGNLPLTADIVGAIAIPVIPGEKYAITRYKNHPTNFDVEGPGFESVVKK